MDVAMRPHKRAALHVSYVFVVVVRVNNVGLLLFFIAAR